VPVSPRVGILALQGATQRHAAVLADLGVGSIQVRTPADLETVDALIMPGGESTTVSMLLDSSGVRAPLAARLADGMPAFGTCAGMILLASEVLDGRPDQESFGAIDLVVRRNAFGRQRDSFEADLDVEGLADDPYHAVFIRAPVVEKAGADVEVLAEVEIGPVLCRSGAIMVCSFHPELGADGRLHELFLRSL
jgi:pyridoxal 5'-phosphate synthase pdxT subunit